MRQMRRSWIAQYESVRSSVPRPAEEEAEAEEEEEEEEDWVPVDEVAGTGSPHHCCSASDWDEVMVSRTTRSAFPSTSASLPRPPPTVAVDRRLCPYLTSVLVLAVSLL
jgi:hypothetical protein